MQPAFRRKAILVERILPNVFGAPLGGLSLILRNTKTFQKEITFMKMDMILKNIFGISKADGHTEEQLLEREKQLGFKLPNALRQFYFDFGNCPLLFSNESDCSFYKLEELLLVNEKWLVFYGDQFGTYNVAVNREFFNEKELKIYVDYDRMEFTKKAESFNDFLIIVAIDFGKSVFPFRAESQNLTALHESKIYGLFGKPKSDISVEGHFVKKVFWNTPEEITCLRDYNHLGLTISINSKLNDSILKFQELLADLEWVIKPDKTSNEF